MVGIYVYAIAGVRTVRKRALLTFLADQAEDEHWFSLHHVMKPLKVVDSR